MKTMLLSALAALSFMGAPAMAQASLDEAINEIYEVISGPVGQPRDWDRFREMHLSGAQMTVLVPTEDGPDRVVILTVEDYIERNGTRLEEMGFTETETRRQTFVYGGLATVISAYTADRADTGETIATGVNTMILAQDEGEWKIASLAWRSESPDWPIDRAFEAQ